MLVLDTRTLPLRDRRSAIADTLSNATLATFMTPAGSDAEMYMRMNMWNLGGVEVVDTDCSAHTVRRTKPSDEESMLAFTCALEGAGVHRQDDHELLVGPAAVFATDLSAPYDHRVSGTRTTTLKVPLGLLGVSPDLLGPSLAHVGKSPLAPLFSRHIAEVRRVADSLNETAALSAGTAVLALARAVFASVAADERRGREALEDILLMRVKAFVAEHLGHPELGADTVAAATHVSVRHLYNVCAREDLRLEQWIVEQRLANAREDIATAANRLTISDVSRRWGFRNPSHFARRFRNAYGMSPREWQALNSARRVNIPAPWASTGRAD